MVSTQPEIDVTDGSIEWENPDTPPSAQAYVLRNGRRLVRPYFFEFLAHVKRRWAGKNIVDLFAHEFRQRSSQYYVEAVTSGRIRVDGKKVPITYVVRESQAVSHFVHRHEPPVLAEPVSILEAGPDVITVCKPPSIPVHSCGQYRKNSVVGILQAEYQVGPLFPIHRLDRLVSGLLILARNAHTADGFREEIENGRVKKEYVAKVVGVFPETEVEVNAAVLYDAREGISTTVEPVLTCNSEQEHLEGVRPGKDACTRFLRLGTDGEYSIVRCMPLTGRTHQIRVHLKYLGHPIGNDALYLGGNHPAKRSKEASKASSNCGAEPSNGVGVEKPEFGKGQEQDSVSKSEHRKQHLGATDGPSEDIPDAHTSDEDVNIQAESVLQAGPILAEAQGNSLGSRKEKLETEQGSHFDSRSKCEQECTVTDFTVDHMCTHCPGWEPAGYEEEEVGIWLHCIKYSCEKWSYDCPLPIWCR